ncbi:hypothetical protein B296_00050864, partial [Ensete ventricosum]
MSRKTHRPQWRPRKIFAPPRHRTRSSRTWPAEKKTDRAAVRMTTGIEFSKGFGGRTAALRCQIKANKNKIKKRPQGRLMNPRERGGNERERRALEGSTAATSKKREEEGEEEEEVPGGFPSREILVAALEIMAATALTSPGIVSWRARQR